MRNLLIAIGAIAVAGNIADLITRILNLNGVLAVVLFVVFGAAAYYFASRYFDQSDRDRQ